MKRALVTGGSGALGSAICKQLASSGIFVYVHANSNSGKAIKLAGEINDGGGHASAVAFDVSQTDECATQLQQLLVDGPIQILVNNAGIHDDAIMAGMNEDQWKRVIDINLNGFFNVTQPLLLPMMQTRWGRVINISSIAGVMGNRGQANYAAAKAGLIGATKSLAQEMASRHITVNVVAPGIIESDMTAEIFDQSMIKSLVPMKRAGRADEVASVVNFLASDDASYVSSQVIGVNGAMA